MYKSALNFHKYIGIMVKALPSSRTSCFIAAPLRRPQNPSRRRGPVRIRFVMAKLARWPHLLAAGTDRLSRSDSESDSEPGSRSWKKRLSAAARCPAWQSPAQQ